MVGGWFDLLCTYRGTLLGLVYGMCFPFSRSKVTTKKFIVVLFASIVIFSP